MIFGDILNNDNSVFDASIKSNLMLKRAIDRLSDQKAEFDDPEKIKELDSKYEDFEKSLTNININMVSLSNYIETRSVQLGSLMSDERVPEKSSLVLATQTLDKIKIGINQLKSIINFSISIVKREKVNRLINRFNELLTDFNVKESFLAVFNKHEDLFDEIINYGNKLIQNTLFYVNAGGTAIDIEKDKKDKEADKEANKRKTETVVEDDNDDAVGVQQLALYNSDDESDGDDESDIDEEPLLRRPRRPAREGISDEDLDLL